jgi:glycogen operon protein
VNFITAHDGFTLNDLVSFNHKHNEANGEHNRDGTDDNASWNCGAEGPTGDEAIEALRNRQAKNLLALTFLAAGTPMLLMGDEVRRSQGGNNNAYCHDSDISWFDWTLLERHADLHRFARLLAAFRQRRDVVLERGSLSLDELLRRARPTWHGVALDRPDWSDRSHAIALTLDSVRATFQVHVVLNAYWEPLEFALPPCGGGASWRRCIDTANATPDDINPWSHAPPFSAGFSTAHQRSVVVLARRSPAG